MNDYTLSLGVAQLLSDSGIGVLHQGSAPAKGEVNITYRDPDEGQFVGSNPQICITPYDHEDDPTLSTSRVRIQFRFRGPKGKPTVTDDLAARVFDRLHGETQTTLSSGVRLVQALRISSSYTMREQAGSWTRTDNYEMIVHRPSMHRT